MLGLLCLFPSAHAAEAEDPSLEVIEMLGELDDEDVVLDIAMSDIGENLNEKIASPQEVKDEK
jgi:hypothetical protein